jgi:hypothetical protein
LAGLRDRLLSGCSMRFTSRPFGCALRRAVAADFFLNSWCLEIPSDNYIRHVPRCVHYRAQGFRVEALEDFYVGSGRSSPELSPDWFGYCSMYEKFVRSNETRIVQVLQKPS